MPPISLFKKNAVSLNYDCSLLAHHPSLSPPPCPPPPQATLRSREAISLYYDCTLIADDETAPLESRDVVLRPLEQQEGGGPRSFDCCPHPDPAKTGVVMTRAVSERKLYLQVGGGGGGQGDCEHCCGSLFS